MTLQELRLPHRVALIGFDDLPLASPLEPGIEDHSAVARRAFTPITAVARNLTVARRRHPRPVHRGTRVIVARPANRTEALAAVLTPVSTSS
ncbi:hypothetical protein AB0I51_47705 [Streptomyces sp. NPDC050549]|uniref:hypothetical protein n=1 Tax=Streptomyces sp. NPDC050549 TaxID=3155406 RepID=UPI003448D575